MLPRSLYRYVWHTTRHRQIRILALTAVIAPLAMVPLELQRRIIDQAINDRNVRALLLLGGVYLLVVLIQGAFKFILNITKGRVLEDVARDIRRRVVDRVAPDRGPDAAQAAAVDEGTTVSVLAAESEDVAGFASESLSVPALQFGTVIAVAGYLLWVEPLIAMLAILVYLPQAIVVPRVQHAINRLSRLRTRTVRRLGHEAARLGDGPAGLAAALARRAGVLIEHIYATRLRIYRRKYFLAFIGNFLDALGPIIVLIVGGYLVIRGETEVSTLVVFISGFQKLAAPWDQLINFYRSASNAHVSYALITGVLRGGSAEGSPRAEAAHPTAIRVESLHP